MSFCDLENTDYKDLPIGKLIAIVSKSQATYLNYMLKELNITSPQLHVLFEISRDSQINQEKIASRCNTDKGAIARSIRKLEENGLVKRTVDENNRRQNIISLTPKGSEVLEKSIDILNQWENSLFDDNESKEEMQHLLKRLAVRSIRLNEERFKNE